MDADEHRDAAARLEEDYRRGALAADEYLELKLRLADAPVAPAEAVLPEVSEAVRPDLPPALQYASWGRRAAAALLDFVLLTAVFAASILWSVATEDPDTGEISDSAALGIFFVFFVLPILYPWLMVGRWGQTLGKMALGAKVLRAETQERVGYARALGRLAAGWLLGIFVLPLLLAWLWPLWDERRQTLYDKMADTVVVRVRAMSLPDA